MNHFFKITSNGGYIGRWYWGNTGIHPSMEHWGSVHWLPNNILATAWAGSFWAVRYICLCSSQP